MQIIDAQIHLWSSGLPSNPSHWQIISFTPQEAIAKMDEAGVNGAVIYPPAWDPGAVDLAHRAVQDFPGRFAYVLQMPWDTPDKPAWITAARAHPGFLGARLLLHRGDARTAFLDGKLDDAWAALAAADLPVTVLLDGTFTEIGAVAERYPRLRLTIDHLGGRGGFETAKDDAAMSHIPDLLKLAAHDNIAVKASGLPHYSGEPYPFPAMQGYLRRTIDAFGPDRVFWGTDISKMPCTWHACITMFTEELDWLQGSDLERVMGGALKDWWNWH